jgi:hypothetical protein
MLAATLIRIKRGAVAEMVDKFALAVEGNFNFIAVFAACNIGGYMSAAASCIIV